MELQPGATAVVVTVPAADPLVQAVRRQRAASPLVGVPAHVTVLYPFLDLGAIDGETLAELGRICAREPAFDLVLRAFGQFSEVLWLAPEPAGPFRRLTTAVAARWPQLPPYGGRWLDPIPHLTVVELDHRDPTDPLHRHAEVDDPDRLDHRVDGGGLDHRVDGGGLDHRVDGGGLDHRVDGGGLDDARSAVGESQAAREVFAAVQRELAPRLPIHARVDDVHVLAFDGQSFTSHARLPLG